MAADSQNTQRAIEEGSVKFSIGKKIEKAIIKSIFGKLRSPLALFEQSPTDNVEEANGARLKRISEILKIIRDRANIKNISLETKENESLVKEVLEALLKSEKIERIFELMAEVRLEKILGEEVSEIEYLQLFSNFLIDFILFYPYPKSVEKKMVGIVTSTAPGATVISRNVAELFAAMYVWLNTFQEGIEQKIAELKREELEELQDRGRVSSEEEREKMVEERRTNMLKKEKELRAQISLETFPKLSSEFEKYLSQSFLEENPVVYMQRILKRQVDAIKIKLTYLGDEVARKQEELKASEKKEKEVVPVPVDETAQLLESLKDFLMKKKGISEDDAILQAKAFLDEAKQENIGLPAVPPLLPSLLSSQMAAASPGSFKPNFLAALKTVVLRSIGDPSKDAERQFDELVSNTGQINQKAVEDAKGGLKKTKAAKFPEAIKYTLFTSKDKDLAEHEILHVLSAFPEGEELDRLENGYILIGHEKYVTARLYYLQKDKEDKLVECHRGDLTPLCKHVSESLGVQGPSLKLNRKQQRDLIITPCGGHNHKEAKAAALVSAPALPQSQPLAQSRSGSFSAGVPQKKFVLDGYTMVLLKGDQDWPKDADVVDKTLYFKWDKSKNTLAVRHKLEDGTVSDFGRPITFPKNIKLVSDEFERLEQSEAFEVTAEASKFLQNFAENPNPEISRRMSVALPPKPLQPSQQSDAQPVSSSEKGKEKMKDGRGSPKEGEKLSSSPKASFYAPAEAPQPTSTDAKIEEDVNPPVKKVGLNNSQ